MCTSNSFYAYCWQRHEKVTNKAGTILNPECVRSRRCHGIHVELSWNVVLTLRDAEIETVLLIVLHVSLLLSSSLLLLQQRCYLQNIVHLCRKYLRDVDRIQLSQLAFVYCLDALEEKSQKPSLLTSEAGSVDDDDDRLHQLLFTYQVRQHAAKMQATQSHRADKLLMSAYHTYIDAEVFHYSISSQLIRNSWKSWNLKKKFKAWKVREKKQYRTWISSWVYLKVSFDMCFVHSALSESCSLVLLFVFAVVFVNA